MISTIEHIGIFALLALFALSGHVVRIILTGVIFAYSLICIARRLPVRRLLTASIFATLQLFGPYGSESIQDIGNCGYSSSRANHARRTPEKYLQKAMIAMGNESNQVMQSNDAIIESIQSNDAIDRFHLGRATKILFHVTGF